MRAIRSVRRLRRRAGVLLAALAVAIGGSTATVLAFAATEAPAATGASSSPRAHCHSSPRIAVEPFGIAPATPYSAAQETYRYTLTNCHGMQVRLLTYGAITQSMTVPDKHRHMTDVVLGFPTLNDYLTFDSPPPTSPNFGGPYFGETVGRYANRIAKGTFHLNGQTYTLPINNGPNSLHGGFVGFGSRPWDATRTTATKRSASVKMQLVSPNGDEGSGLLPGTKDYEPDCAIPSARQATCTGFPAQVTLKVTFTLDNSNRFWIHYAAHNDDSSLSTVINLTNHSYFNLAGEASGSAENQLVHINGDAYSPTDSTQIPTGQAAAVGGTPFDFTHLKPIAPSIEDCTAGTSSLGCQQLLIAHGFDHNWILNQRTPATTGPEGLNLAARALDPVSGRKLTVWTDEPGVQMYTSNFLTGTLVGISGHIYRQTQAYTFETQHFPDSPNEPSFPSTVLGSGTTFNSTTIFAFSS
jgi:aldose 1-epimerase